MSLPHQRTWVAGTNGPNSGTLNANGDYSSAATDFWVGPLDEKPYKITRVIVGIDSGSSTETGKYGDLATLTNGVDVIISDGTTEVSLTPITIKSTGDWKKHCYDTEADAFGAINNVTTAVRWTFKRHGGALYLKGGCKLIFRLNDDFTGLGDHRFTCEGELGGFHDKH